MGKSTSYQLKGVNPIQFLALFQNIQFTAAEDLQKKQNKAKQQQQQKTKNKQSKRKYVQLELQDAYLCVPFSLNDQKSVMFRWKETVYQFLACNLAWNQFYVWVKLLQAHMTFLKTIEICIEISLGDMFITVTKKRMYNSWICSNSCFSVRDFS